MLKTSIIQLSAAKPYKPHPVLPVDSSSQTGNATTQDCTRPISQIVEEINKVKGKNALGSVFGNKETACRNVLIMIDLKSIKEQLECNSKSVRRQM